MTDKNILRQFLKEKRAKAFEAHVNAGDAVASLLLPLIPVASRVACYWPMGTELDIQSAFGPLLAQNCTILLPRIASDRLLTFHAWSKDVMLEVQPFGFQGPPASPTIIPHIILVPLLGFDEQLNRLGYGKGHYDTTIAHMMQRHTIKTIGIAFDEQYVKGGIPTESHDHPLDYVATPTKVYKNV